MVEKLQDGKGRPRGSKVLPLVKEDLLKHIRAGVPYRFACEAVGVPYQTYAEWLRQGAKQKTGMYIEFAEAVQQARGEAVSRNVAIIQTAAKKSWQAAAWWLERSHPTDFGRPDRRDIEGENKPTHVVFNINKPDKPKSAKTGKEKGQK